MTPETSSVVIAIGRALVWLAIALVGRNALQLWIRYKEDQAAIARAKLGIAPPAVAQHVPRGTHGVPDVLNGNRNRLAALSRPDDIVIPDDLEAYCMQWDDSWARDDERAVLRAKFAELYTGDATETWQRVRRAVGIGEMP